MSNKQFFKFIKAVHFFTVYAPTVNSWHKKLAGSAMVTKNWAFSPEDLAAIERGKKKFIKDITK